MEPEHSFGVPRWVQYLAGIVVIGLLCVGITVWAVLKNEQADCNRVVNNRDDGRAVWMYVLGAQDPDRRDDSDVLAFEVFLNDRLPELRCTGFFGRNPTPVTEDA